MFLKSVKSWKSYSVQQPVLWLFVNMPDTVICIWLIIFIGHSGRYWEVQWFQRTLLQLVICLKVTVFFKWFVFSFDQRKQKWLKQAALKDFLREGWDTKKSASVGEEQTVLDTCRSIDMVNGVVKSLRVQILLTVKPWHTAWSYTPWMFWLIHFRV